MLRDRRRARRAARSGCSRRATRARARCATRSTATDLQRIYDEIDDDDLEVGVIYHSHTRSDPVPSQTDINLAPFLPDAVYLIVGVKDPERDDVRAWHIRDGQVSEAPLEIDED